MEKQLQKDFSYKGKGVLLKELKALQKKIQLNEEDDIFLDQLNKKIRNLNKKLDQIIELESKPKEELKESQLEKINSKASIQDEIDQQVSLKITYFKAHEKAQESQSKDIFKKSENSLVGIQVQKVTDEIFSEFQALLTVGKLLRSNQYSPQSLEIKDLSLVQKIVQLYEKCVLLQYDPLQDDTVEETLSSTFLSQSLSSLKTYITSQTAESATLRSQIREIYDRYQKTNQTLLAKDSVLLTAVNSQKRYEDALYVESEKEVEPILESEEREEAEESKPQKQTELTEKPQTQHPQEKEQSQESSGRVTYEDNYNSEKQHYEGDSENSQQQRNGRAPGSNYNPNTRRNNNQNYNRRNNADSQNESWYGGSNRRNNNFGANQKKIVYYKKNFEDSYDDSQKRK